MSGLMRPDQAACRDQDESSIRVSAGLLNHQQQHQQLAWSCRVKKNITYQMSWIKVSISKLKTGMPKCHRVLWSARFMALTSSRQSKDRLPLVMEAKAKLMALNSQCRLPGKGMFTLLIRVMYCIHSVTPCKETPDEQLCRTRPCRQAWVKWALY